MSIHFFNFITIKPHFYSPSHSKKSSGDVNHLREDTDKAQILYSRKKKYSCLLQIERCIYRVRKTFLRKDLTYSSI